MATKTKKSAGEKNKPAVMKTSNDLYYSNLNALKKRYPALAEKIEQVQLRNCKIAYPGSPDMPNLFLSSLNRYYYDVNNPIEDAMEQLRALNLKNTRIAIFLGMGLGYELLCFTQMFAQQQKTMAIAVVESDLEIFKACLETVDLQAVINNPSIELLVGLTQPELFVKLRDFMRVEGRYYYSKSFSHVYHPSSIALNRDYYVQTLKSFREAVVYVICTFGNAPDDSLIGLKNILANLGEIINNPGINLLFNAFKGKPAVVVSTGPSLNKNKHLLKGLEDKALIVAADASLKVLIDMGVKPHLVTSLERDIEVVPLLEGFTREQLDGVYLAACPVLMPECYRAYNGPRIIVYRDFQHFRWLGIERGILPIQLSAGNMAFLVAAAMGCDPVILIGQDLAFGRSGDTHANGTFYGDKQEYFYNEEKHFEVMGNDGRPILTTETWYSFLKAYEIDVAEYQGKCVNSTEGGAYIAGTTVMTFADAIQKYTGQEFYPRQLIADTLSSFTVEDARRDVQKVMNIIDDTISDLELMKGYCREGIKTCELYHAELSAALAQPETITSEFRDNLPAIEKEIISWRAKCIELHNTFNPFLVHIIQSYVVSSQINAEAAYGKYEDRDLATIEVLLALPEWFSVVSNLITECLKALSESRQNLS